MKDDLMNKLMEEVMKKMDEVEETGTQQLLLVFVV